MNREFNFNKFVRVLSRWPLFFVVPFLLVVTGLLIYITNLKIYDVKSVVLFESNYIPIEEYFTLLDKFEDQPVQLVRSLLYGQPAKEIVTSIWPETRDNLPAINNKINHLRSRNGVSLKFQRDNPQALQVTYENDDPLLAYRVVDQVLNQLIAYNRRITQKKLKTGSEFIADELETTKQELSQIEQEITKVRSTLPKSALRSLDSERANYADGLNLTKLKFGESDQFLDRYNEDKSLSQLEFELQIGKKELKLLESELKSSAYLKNAENLAEVLKAGEDPEIKSLNSSIIATKQELGALRSKGFRAVHPDVKTLSNKLESLNELRAERLIQLQNRLTPQKKELTKLSLQQLQRKKIDRRKKLNSLLKDQIKSQRELDSRYADREITLEDRLKDLSDKKSELIELENKKIVTQHSYAQMAKRLAVIQRESRVDQDKFGLAVKIVEPPQVPKNAKAFAWLPLVLLAMTVTIAILLAIAALIALLDTKIYSSSELQKQTGINVIGSVDHFSLASKQKSFKNATRIFLLIVLAYCVFIYFLVN